MRRRVLRKVSLVLGSALGVAGCPFAAEYGMPHADFDLDGKVVESGTDTPIQGVQVDFDGFTATTDGSGDWAISAEGAFACGPPCQVMATDVDGDANGSFEEVTTDFVAEKVTEGSGSWYEGEWEAHDIEIEMEPSTGDRRR